MKIKECYVSKNGISCFTDLNTMHNLKNIKIDNINLKKNILFYLLIRSSEFIIKDLINNVFYLKNLNINDNNDLLSYSIFN